MEIIIASAMCIVDLQLNKLDPDLCRLPLEARILLLLICRLALEARDLFQAILHVLSQPLLVLAGKRRSQHRQPRPPPPALQVQASVEVSIGSPGRQLQPCEYMQA